MYWRFKCGRRTRPIWLGEYSVNHMLPSGPAVMNWTSGLAVGTEEVVRAFRELSSWKMALPVESQIHTLPSGPAAIAFGVAPAGPPPPTKFVNHKLPSGPAVMSYTRLFGSGAAPYLLNLCVTGSNWTTQSVWPTNQR